MRTKEQKIVETKHLHAKPKSSHQLQNLEDGELPFDLKLWDWDSYGDEETSYLGEVEVTYVMPGGIDLRQGVIEALENKLEDKEREFKRVKREIEERIKELRLIGYDPNPVELADGGDIIDVYDESGTVVAGTGERVDGNN